MSGVSAGAWGDAGPRSPGLDQRAQLRLRRLHRDPIFQTPNDPEIVVAASPKLLGRDAEWQPELRVCVHQIGAGRQDADDLSPSSAEIDMVSHHGLPPEGALPQTVREDGHRRLRGRVRFLFREETPLHRLHAERLHQRRVDHRRADANRAIASREIGLVQAEGADLTERRVEPLELQVLRHRDLQQRRTGPGRIQIHQLCGAWIGERTQQHAVHDREDGGVCADPERERQDRDRREDRRAPQGPQPVPCVARHIGQHARVERVG